MTIDPLFQHLIDTNWRRIGDIVADFKIDCDCPPGREYIGCPLPPSRCPRSALSLAFTPDSKPQVSHSGDRDLIVERKPL